MKINDSWLNICLEIIREKHKEQLTAELNFRRLWQHELNSIEEKLRTLLDLRINGEINELEYLGKKQDLIETKLTLESRLNDSGQTTTNWLERIEEFFRASNLAVFVFEHGTLEEKRDLVKSLGWNLFLEDGNLIWNYRKPFDSLIKPIIDSEKAESEIELNKIWLRSVYDVRTIFEKQDSYVYILDLRP